MFYFSPFFLCRQQKKSNFEPSLPQQKISADFMIELLHEDDLDDGDELPGLNNDEISDRDDLAEVW